MRTVRNKDADTLTYIHRYIWIPQPIHSTSHIYAQTYRAYIPVKSFPIHRSANAFKNFCENPTLNSINQLQDLIEIKTGVCPAGIPWSGCAAVPVACLAMESGWVRGEVGMCVLAVASVRCDDHKITCHVASLPHIQSQLSDKRATGSEGETGERHRPRGATRQGRGSKRTPGPFRGWRGAHATQ